VRGGWREERPYISGSVDDYHVSPSLLPYLPSPSFPPQGLGATIMKQGSNQGLRFMFFNEYKNWITDNGKVPLTPITSFLGGMSAGCFSTLCNNPLGEYALPPSLPPSLPARPFSSLAFLSLGKRPPRNPTNHSLPPALPPPLDVIKTRMQGLDAAKYSNALDCARQLTKTEGFGVFLRGLVPRLGRVVPGQGIIFMSFESIQNKLVEVLL